MSKIPVVAISNGASSRFGTVHILNKMKPLVAIVLDANEFSSRGHMAFGKQLLLTIVVKGAF
ncbi:MAG: hypothetical protein AAFX87_04890 [Bacteroidota bacterium]